MHYLNFLLSKPQYSNWTAKDCSPNQILRILYQLACLQLWRKNKIKRGPYSQRFGSWWLYLLRVLHLTENLSTRRITMVLSGSNAGQQFTALKIVFCVVFLSWRRVGSFSSQIQSQRPPFNLLLQSHISWSKHWMTSKIIHACKSNSSQFRSYLSVHGF